MVASINFESYVSRKCPLNTLIFFGFVNVLDTVGVDFVSGKKCLKLKELI